MTATRAGIRPQGASESWSRYIGLVVSRRIVSLLNSKYQCQSQLVSPEELEIARRTGTSCEHALHRV